VLCYVLLYGVVVCCLLCCVAVWRVVVFAGVEGKFAPEVHEEQPAAKRQHVGEEAQVRHNMRTYIHTYIYTHVHIVHTSCGYFLPPPQG